MRITFFVTLISQLVFSLAAFAQVGLNGQISSQTGFTRNQIERAIDPPGGQAAAIPPGTVVIYGGSQNKSCMKTTCQLVGTFGCDDQEEIIGMTAACRGQANDECLTVSCQALGQFACDEFQEVRRIAINCGTGETLLPAGQRVQDLTVPQKPTGF